MLLAYYYCNPRLAGRSTTDLREYIYASIFFVCFDPFVKLFSSKLLRKLFPNLAHA